MVLKLIYIYIYAVPSAFESDVISDGTQTMGAQGNTTLAFESDVISDGTQTHQPQQQLSQPFESDVISDGTQTLVM